jgi:hypothetical protein
MFQVYINSLSSNVTFFRIPNIFRKDAVLRLSYNISICAFLWAPKETL